MDKLVVDCTTRTSTLSALTAAEVQAVNDRIAAATPIAAADDLAASNAATVRQRAASALTANATFLAIASPTNAQTLAQMQRMTKECNALIRLAVGLLDTITDTA